MSEGIKIRKKLNVTSRKAKPVLIGFARKRYFPNILRRIENMESDEKLKKFHARIEDWISRANSRNKSDDEITELKLEAGQIIVDFNFWFSERDNEGFQEL